MCLMTEKQTPHTDGEIEEENMLTEVFNENDRLYSPLTVGKENKSTVTDDILLSDIGGYPEQQNKTVALQLQRIPTQFSSELPGDYSLLNTWIQERDVQHLSNAISQYEEWIIERIDMLTEKEQKEYIRQLFVMQLLIILIKNICENIKCKQSSCRKYPCLNSILYLLWQSGDVEVNPGPAKSITYRNWLYEVCPIARKAITGFSTDCKMNKIWQQKPKNWPPKESYFNPRVKGVNEVEDLLINLLHCCDDTSKLPHDISSEIDTWNAHRSKDNGKLLHLYRTRKCCMSIEQVNKSLNVLQSHLSSYNALVIEGNTCIRISLSCQPAIDQQVITHKIYKSEATRKISSFLCRILHGKDPERKCDHIWTLTPDGWPSHLRYYNPNNGGEGSADGRIVKALITLCEKKSIIFPTSYQDMVDAWQADDQTLLSKLLTRHTAETDLKKAVRKLHEEGLLQEVDEHLKELGLLVQCDGSTQNAKSQKRKMVNAMNKHETKVTKQSDHEEAVESTVKELLPGCSIGQLLDNQSDSLLLDKISQNLPDCLVDEADDIQFHWNE